jgi:Sulfotransferase family
MLKFIFSLLCCIYLQILSAGENDQLSKCYATSSNAPLPFLERFKQYVRRGLHLKPQRLYFIHIPKTGGTSLHTLLENQIDLADLYPPRHFGKINQQVHHQLVSGHIPYWFCKQLDPEFDRTFKVTILRNPIERYLSALRYRKLNHRELHALDLQGVHNHLDRTRYVYSQGNLLCRFLASLPNLEGNELLENAKQALHTFDAVLFLENFEEDVQNLCKRLGVQIQKDAVPNVNTTSPEKISEAFMAAIREYNALDIELYEYAKMHLKPKQNTFRFKISQPLSEKLTKVDYKFDMPLLGTNWCYRENVDRFSPEFPIYRWVMNKPAKIYFNLKANHNYRICFFARLLCSETSPHLLVNGVEIPLHQKLEREFSPYECLIPKELISDQITELTFFSPKSCKFNEVYPGNADNRKLSFALNRIKIKKCSSVLRQEEN